MKIAYRVDMDPDMIAEEMLKLEHASKVGKYGDLFSDIKKFKYDFSGLGKPMTTAAVEKALGLTRNNWGGCPSHAFLRGTYVGAYSWSVPTLEVLQEIIAFADGPIEEHMAGGGYWAYLLRQLGAAITAYDIGENENYEPKVFWTDVAQHNAAEGPISKEATIMVQWPPMEHWDNIHDYDNRKEIPGSDGSSPLIEKMQIGQKLVYVGEGWGGCTGTERFHDILGKCFARLSSLEIPQWPGLGDHVHLFTKVVKEFDPDGPDIADE